MASRLTFRDKCPDVCWQKQLRDRYMAQGVPPVPHLDVKRAIVRPVSRHMAEQVILKYEWLGSMSPSNRHFGIFFGAFCAGVECAVAAGAPGTGGVNAHMPFRIERSELATLARGACVHWAPAGTNSRPVSWTCRLLSAEGGSKVLIAYADADAGEIGTIYQACGWTYIGRGSSTNQWVSTNGRVMDAKTPANYCRTHGGTRSEWVKRLRDAGWREQPSNPKHRYVYVLDKSDKALVARIEAMRQTYPKRPPSIAADAPCIQQGEGGSTPTGGLETSEVAA